MLVNGSKLNTYADVTLTGLNGDEIRRQRVEFTPHSQRRLEVHDLLQDANLATNAGRITVMQSAELKGMSIAAQLSMTYRGPSKPVYIDEETAMPTAEGSQVLRAVSDKSDGTPLIAITSLTEIAQQVTIECFSETGQNSRATVELTAEQTLITSACMASTHRLEDLDSLFRRRSERAHGAFGIELSSNTMPGSFAAFGIVPHTKGNDRYFSAISFSDPKLIVSPNIIFTGVPVGPVSLLPGGQYVPELALTNFSAGAAHVEVKVAQTRRTSSSAETVRNLIVAPRSSASLS